MEFEAHDGLVMEFGPADRDLNTLYDAAVRNWLAPRALALQLGRVSEEEQLDLAMRTYAFGVVTATEPEMSEQEVYEWFVSHPDDFATLVSYADHRENFVDPDEPEQTGPSTAPSLEEAG